MQSNHLHQISQEVLDQIARTIEANVQDSAIRKYMRVVLDRKLIHPNETRVNWLYFAFRLAGGCESRDIIPLAIAYELLLLAMYHLNMVFDSKGPLPIHEPKERNNVIISTELLRSLSERVIFDSPYSRELKFLFVSELNDCYFHFMQGQFSDLNRNQFAVDETNYELRFSEREYWNRVRLINAWMYRSITRSAIALSGVRVFTFEHSLLKFGLLYGYIIQLVNDTIDFVPASLQTGTAEKESGDAYADIRNRHITLPFYLYWKKLSSSQKQNFLEHFTELTDPTNQTLARDMVSTGAIREAQVVVQRMADQCRKLIPVFPEEYRKVLKSFLIIAYSNRFYKAFQKLK